MAETIKEETVNVEQNSIFTEAKDIWWDLNTPVRTLFLLNARVLEYMKEVLRKQNLVIGSEGFQLPKDLNILDVGCGGGILTEPFARTGASILGIDVNRSMIEVAQEHAKLDPCLKNLPYRWESIEKHSKDNVEKYDIVILNFVLHHVRNHDTLLKACLKTLKPGGIIFASGIGKTYEGHCDLGGVKGMVYDIFSTSVKWTDNTNALYLMHAIKQ